ncbi:MAG: ABC transporter substrate-binding protein [Trueperaceae bacterium]|nr:ABC transporter substrate-binding protein [Trueperaceae bacterium]
MKRILFSLVAVAVVSMAFAQPFVWPNAWTVAEPGEAVTGGTFRDYSISDPRTFSPVVSAEQNAMIDTIDLLGASLLTRGPDSDEWIAYAASEFSVNDGGTVVEMTLRDGIKWSDGSPVTVQDYYIRYLIETDADAQSNAYDSWFLNEQQIQLEITGENTLRFTFPGPDRLAFPNAALLPLPDKIFGEAYRSGGAEAVRALWGTETPVDQILTTGPFMPVQYAPGERLNFVANPYFGEWNVDEQGNALPYLANYNITLVGDADAALNLYIAGEIDTFGPRNLDDIGVINVAINNGDIDAVMLEDVAPVANSQFIVFNWNLASDPVKQATFRNPNFRRAMAHLIDRDAIIELIYGGSADPMYTSVYLVNGYWVNPDVPTYAYDVERAVELLALAGYRNRDAQGFLTNADGVRLSFTLATNAGNNQREQIIQIFADSAREAGVEVITTPIDFNLLVDQLFSTGDDRPFDAILIGLRGGSRDWPFGDNVNLCTGGLHMFNTSGSCIGANETLVDQLTKVGRQTLDTEAAREIGFQIQQAEAEQSALLYTVSPRAHYSWLTDVRGEHPVEFLNPLLGSRELALTFKAQ